MDIVLHSGDNPDVMASLENVVGRLGMPQLPPVPEEFRKVKEEILKWYALERHNERIWMSPLYAALTKVSEDVYQRIHLTDISFDTQRYLRRIAEIMGSGVNNVSGVYSLMVGRRGTIHDPNFLEEFEKRALAHIESKMGNLPSLRKELVLQLGQRVYKAEITFWAHSAFIQPIAYNATEKIGDNREDLVASYTVLEVFDFYLSQCSHLYPRS